MKRRLFKSLLTIVCLLGSTSVSAYDFEVDGVYYNIVSLSDLTCRVTRGNVEYKGDFVIPATVNYANKTLTVVGVSYSAFQYCHDLTGITIPNTVSAMDYLDMFVGCSSLEHITIEDGDIPLKMGNYVVTNEKNIIIEWYSIFYECPIKTVYIGRNIEMEYDEGKRYPPFRGIQTLNEVTIGNSVTTIGDYTFYGCSSLASIVIPNSVTAIGGLAFKGCDALTSIYSLNTTPPSVVSGNFTNNQYMTSNVYVPQEALEAYQSADVWKDFWNLQGSDFTSIETVKANNKSTDRYYDIRGNRYDTPKHGLNIINGKKVIVK